MFIYAMLPVLLAQPPMDSPRMKMQDLAFMTGTWECEVWNGDYEETWFSPSKDTMQGMSRLLQSEFTKVMEFACIEERNGRLTYYVMMGKPSAGQKTPSAFACKQTKPGYAEFERTGDSFPQKIVYVRVDEDHMTATISGKEAGVEQKPVKFKFKRSKR